jgi:anti-sigma B factor antagonist
MDANWQTPMQDMASVDYAKLAELCANYRNQPKESKLKLRLETRYYGDVMIVNCYGRLVYREEAVALSRLVGELLESRTKVIVDLSGVSSMDSAGIGELVLLHTLAQAKNADLKFASPSPTVLHLFGLTRLDSFLDVHPTLGESLESFQPQEACADC